LAAFVVPIFVISFWGLPWTALRIAGLAIAIPSFLLFALARIQLGRAFSLRAKATMLVTTGIYCRIRNPIYVFGGLMLAGLILWTNQPLLLLVFTVHLPVQVYRSRKEEQALVETFGTSYLDYKRKTWF
jgi:protein-S-isoprenylcysteine O-methyltransferase Ste14